MEKRTSLISILFLLGTVLSVIYYYRLYLFEWMTVVTTVRNPNAFTIGLVNNTIGASGLILLWTPFFGDWKWALKMDDFADICRNCSITNDRSFTHSADVVIFHCRDFYGSSVWPSVRPPGQLYAVYCMESPAHSSLNQFGNRINITLTYRLDSDIPHPYTRLSHNAKPEPYVNRIPLRNKTKMVVWPVSNCSPPSKRGKYVQQLAKHISVDMYGACGPLKCPRSIGQKCLETFEKKYKFYLAFENSICMDYATEKLKSALERELVPIVLGGANYSKMAPSHSYIDVKDFTSPKHLAQFLKTLAQNETAYSEYFQWKSNYFIDPKSLSHAYMFWEVLKKARTPGFKQMHPDLGSWWSHKTCDNSLVTHLLRNAR